MITEISVISIGDRIIGTANTNLTCCQIIADRNANLQLEISENKMQIFPTLEHLVGMYGPVDTWLKNPFMARRTLTA